jgi:hypothetical protein
MGMKIAGLTCGIRCVDSILRRGVNLSLVRVSVNPGVCGFVADLSVEDKDGTLTARVVTSCPRVAAFIGKAGGLDAYDVAFTPLNSNPVMQLAGEANLHAACPMPTALIKAIEVVAGLALPTDVDLRFLDGIDE